MTIERPIVACSPGLTVFDGGWFGFEENCDFSESEGCIGSGAPYFACGAHYWRFRMRRVCLTMAELAKLTIAWECAMEEITEEPVRVPSKIQLQNPILEGGIA